MLQFSTVLIDRVLGLLAQTMGQFDKATEHFEDALAFSRKASYRPELAWSCYDYADTLLQRDGPGDRARAISLLDEGLSLTHNLGMVPSWNGYRPCKRRWKHSQVQPPSIPMV